MKLTGTTTFTKDAIHRLAERRGLGAHGYLEVAGSIQREPENQADPTAIAVHVEVGRIGYLPGCLACAQSLSAGGSRLVQMQIFAKLLPKGLPKTKRPPLSSEAKNQAAHQGSVSTVQSR